MAIPIHWRWFSISWPSIHAIMAAATGMRAEKMLDLAKKNALLVMNQDREKIKI